MYVYLRYAPGVWSVGHYTPQGEWQIESTHATQAAAVARVNFLNGGGGATDDDVLRATLFGGWLNG